MYNVRVTSVLTVCSCPAAGCGFRASQGPACHRGNELPAQCTTLQATDPEDGYHLHALLLRPRARSPHHPADHPALGPPRAQGTRRQENETVSHLLRDRCARQNACCIFVRVLITRTGVQMRLAHQGLARHQTSLSRRHRSLVRPSGLSLPAVPALIPAHGGANRASSHEPT